MTPEEKDLLLKDLCARLPHKQKVCYKIHTSSEEITATLSGALLDYFKTEEIKVVRPYLRPMSSMTDEEERELSKKYVWNINCGQIEIRYHCEGYWDDDTECPTKEYLNLFDWLNAHHFDYRGLIPMGLALEAPEGMYNKNTK